MDRNRFVKDTVVCNVVKFPVSEYYGKIYPFLRNFGNLGVIVECIGTKYCLGYKVLFDASPNVIFMYENSVEQVTKPYDECIKKLFLIDKACHALLCADRMDDMTSWSEGKLLEYGKMLEAKEKIAKKAMVSDVMKNRFFDSPHGNHRATAHGNC